MNSLLHRSTALTQDATTLIQSLNGKPSQAVVRVVVRPNSVPSTGSGADELIDPKQFASPVEYRSALIARQKQRSQPGKDEVVAKAHALGLTASAAGAINAVLVEGKAGQVLHLLRQVGFESAVLDTPFSS